MKNWMAAAMMLVATGCALEFHPGWEQPLEPDGPAMMQEAMVFLDSSFEEIIVVRAKVAAEEPQLEVERVATGRGPATMGVSADGTELYVVNEGSASLSIFEVSAESVEGREVNVASAYDVITADPLGDYVLLSNSGQAREGAVVQNLNEVGIVELQQEEPQARFISLPSRAQNLVFMPPFEFKGEEQRLVVALARSEVTILDLKAEEDEDQWRRVPLTISQADRALIPTQVEFDIRSEEGSDSDVVRVYVLTEGGNDVAEITIQEPIEADEGVQRKFALSVNSLAAGQNPGRIALLDLPQGRRLLALDRGQPRFTLVDISSAESATFTLPMGVAARELRVFDAPVPGESRTEKKVLVYAANSAVVALIRPEGIALGSETPTLGQTVQAIAMNAAPSVIHMDETAGSERAVALHAGGRDGFTVLNLRTNSVISLEGFTPTQLIFDGSRAYGIFGNTAHLVRFDLSTGHAPVFELPARPRDLYLSPDRELLMVRHGGVSGRFTVLPVASPRPENSRFYEHIFLDDVMGHPAFKEK